MHQIDVIVEEIARDALAFPQLGSNVARTFVWTHLDDCFGTFRFTGCRRCKGDVQQASSTRATHAPWSGYTPELPHQSSR